MNWSTKFIVFQLFGQILPDFALSCLSKNQASQNWGRSSQICSNGFSRILSYNNETSYKVECHKDLEWTNCNGPSVLAKYNDYNVGKLYYSDCPWNHTGIHDTNSFLGVYRVKTIIVNKAHILDVNLTRFFMSNLKDVIELEISETITKNLKLYKESFEGTKQLKTLSLRNNGIKELPNGVFINLTNLEALDLGQNAISDIDSELFNGIPLKHLCLDENHLKTLSLNSHSLKYLDISNNILESISIENLKKLVNLSLNYNSLVTMPNKTFKNTSIESIRFNHGNFTIPNEFLTNMCCLRYVRLESLNLTKIPEDMIWNSTNITDLSLASNSLKELPNNFFQNSTKMKVLNLSKNKIEKIDYGLLKPLENLEKLDLSHNSIVQIESVSFSVSKLKNLILSHNNINNLLPNYIFSFKNLPEVEIIDLSHNKITQYNKEWSNLMNLKKVDLAYNNITHLGVEDIQYIGRNVEVDFSYNPLKFINLTDLEQFAIEHQGNGSRNISIAGDQFICDCRNYEFANFVHKKINEIVYKEFKINVKELYCDNKQFSNINAASLTCDWEIFKDSNKINNCSGCVCTYRPHDNSALMDCSNKKLITAPEQIISRQNINYTELNLSNNFIKKLPDYKELNITKLDVSHNNLITINIMKLPKSLEELHLEHNYLKNIIVTDSTHKLTKLNHITMSNNSWVCKCDEKEIYNFIQKYSSKIDDLKDIPCHLFSNLTREQTCPTTNNISTIVMIIVLALSVFGIILTVYKNYKTEISIWLYSHNITWPISEESLDRNKKYDAFISFSHRDDEFVANHLVPGLEEGSSPYKLCIHYRDWPPGDSIPVQIVRSVGESRRTIIVLTKNYLDSVWSLLEFRVAFSSALNERRCRLIVILLGDISIDDLDPELKVYLLMNTYIRWGDKWFWSKLKDALPHRTATIVNAIELR